MLTIIVAVAKNNVIGKDNKLIWHLPEDLKRFKEFTTGHKIIMGRKTFESLGRVLPNRKHIVISRDLKIEHEDVEVISNIEELKTYIDSEEECFVIGGASIYKELLPKCNKIYLTRINEIFEGDTFFPQLKEEEWEIKEIKKGITNDKNPYDYEYITYIRK